MNATLNLTRRLERAAMAGLAGLLMAACLVAAPRAAQAAETEVIDIPDGIIAKMARMNAKQGVNRDGRDDDGPGARSRNAVGGQGCGSLNVGNVDMGKRRIGAPVREVTVIVKGDIVNAAKCR
jgi:hypothetical protein